MSDQLTASPPRTPATGRSRARRLLPLAVRFAAILACFAVGGALAGVLWERLWTPPTGVVLHHQWLLDEKGLRGQFSGTGSYVLVAVVAGFLLGALTAFVLDRQEILTLVAVVAGSALAGWLMYRVGVALGPADPHRLAARSADLTKLPGTLRVVGFSPRCAFPLGAVSGLVVVFFGLSRRHRIDS